MLISVGPDVPLNVFDDDPVRAKAKTVTLFTGLAGANVAAWGWAWASFGNQPALLGTALLAYLFGLRHAFDADHIAAIDNVVRKLMQDGKAPYSAGFFFSLGHSTIVVLASLALATAAVIMQDRLEALHGIGRVIGTGVSASFLLGIGIANLCILRGTWFAFTKARSGGTIGGTDLNLLLAGNGLLTRTFGPLLRAVSRSRHLYPIGLLFGLGFDTATEIGLLGIAATQAAQGVSIWAILVFPALFAAGMTLLDTFDSVLMTRLYGWAFISPARKLWYNLTITAVSVVVALFVGGIEALGLLGTKLGLAGGFWSAIGTLNDNLTSFGFVVAGIFVGSWLIASVFYRTPAQPRPDRRA